MTSSILFGAVGDVFINRPGGEAPFVHCDAALGAADLVFGNAEGVYCDHPRRAITSGIPVVAPRSQAAALADVRFDVMSIANNHTMDAGAEGLLDTIATLDGLGIAWVGAGADLQQAQRAAVIERGGLKFAFLAYSAVFRPGYPARERAPGIAVMRAHSHYYHPDWHPTGQLEPGTPPHVRTFPYPEDLELLRDSIARELAQADRVIVSFHWGQTGPAILHDYERTYAHAAIDAGAHVVLGHHPHFLRAAEVYRGRPIYYGLGHFAFDLGGLEGTLGVAALATRRRLDPYGIFPRENYPLLPFHEDARMTMIAYCTLDTTDAPGDAQPPGFLLPCVINAANQPVPFSADSVPGKKVAAYLEQITTSQGLATRYACDGPVIAGCTTLTVHPG